MKEYIDEVMTRVDTIIRTMRPCVPETVSPLEYIYMSIVEAFDPDIPEPHFTTDDFGWSDLVHHIELRNECDLLAIAVVLATLKSNDVEYCGWDTDHNLTYDADEALRLWTQLYHDAIRCDICVRCEVANSVQRFIYLIHLEALLGMVRITSACTGYSTSSVSMQLPRMY